MDNNKNTKQRKKIVNFYNIFFFAIIPITIVTILLVKTIIICDYILKNNTIETKNFLINNNWIDIGLSVISIAVSVWLGINISNLVDRKQIEDLNNKIKTSKRRIERDEQIITNLENEINNTQKSLETQISNININIENQFYKTRFIDKVMETRELYESSLYLCNVFSDNDDADYLLLYKIESAYISCVMAYENVNWTDAYKYSNEGIKLLDELTDIEKCEEYFYIRKSDFLFYKNIVIPHDSTLGEYSINELEESIFLYKKIVGLIDNETEEFFAKLIGYLYNTIGYTYDMMQLYCKD